MDFHEALVNAEEVTLNSFEKENTLKAVCSIEVMANEALNQAVWTDEAGWLGIPRYDYRCPFDGEI